MTGSGHPDYKLVIYSVEPAMRGGPAAKRTKDRLRIALPRLWEIGAAGAVPAERATNVAQTFLSAGSGDFPVPRSSSHPVLESTGNPQTRMSALPRQSVLHSAIIPWQSEAASCTPSVIDPMKINSQIISLV